ncbi:ABC transporter ATP-binding protein [Paenibacillus sp. MMS18-CY102]|uniref:ABC transporter ATP-binding protein n=1 Tax=Paenibacillus sp. MMS18-CY102 TaxID=2682849 RepID=UPI0013663AC5|nr:ABC transporter ATP-binding protein [Paenibacillus sp. MMS18-CY102]MWC27945.1 ATP-binding cassette domain-containing protein [Paenibacillus sp. MMS18-CY102]
MPQQHSSNPQRPDINVPIGPRPGGGGFASRHRGPGSKPKHLLGALKRLWGFIGTERRRLSIIFGLVVASAGIGLVAPYWIGQAVDAIEGGTGNVSFSLLRIVLLSLLVAYVADAAIGFIQGRWMAGIAQRIVLRLRRELYRKLQTLPLSYFDSRRHGDVMSRLSNDIDNVSNTISQSTVQLMSGVLGIIGALTMMLVLSPILTAASLITVPLVYGLTRMIARRTSELFKAQQAQLGALNGHIEETITGVQVVQAFNQEQRAIEEFNDMNNKLCEISTNAQVWSGLLMPLLSVINNVGFAAVAIVGGILGVKGHISVGVIASFLTYSRQFVRPLNDMAATYNTLQSGIAGAERVFETLDEDGEAPDERTAVPMVAPLGRIEFQNVSFGYKPDELILKQLSFVSEAGTSTAIIGPTGAGKTTIIQLLTRFYEPTEGTITIDGKPIAHYTRDSLRRSFGVVLQDTYLFSGSIRDNLKYGQPDATDEEMVQAAKLANADTFIQRLPNRYDTMLSENGGSLSQGQRQLLAIARAMLAKPKLLILDEATSNIDTRTELHIQEALSKLMQGRTSFIIAHRLNTIRDADSIMVIDQGSIVERGSHDELMSARGAYYEMMASVKATSIAGNSEGNRE